MKRYRFEFWAFSPERVKLKLCMEAEGILPAVQKIREEFRVDEESDKIAHPCQGCEVCRSIINIDNKL